jgi:hypothetical protein
MEGVYCAVRTKSLIFDNLRFFKVASNSYFFLNCVSVSSRWKLQDVKLLLTLHWVTWMCKLYELTREFEITQRYELNWHTGPFFASWLVGPALPFLLYRLHIPPHRNEADDHFFLLEVNPRTRAWWNGNRANHSAVDNIEQGGTNFLYWLQLDIGNQFATFPHCHCDS